MKQSTRQLFNASMERVNAQERQAREEQFGNLLSQGDSSDSFDAFMAKYARFACFGEPASTAAIAELRRLSGPPLPQSLVDFYLEAGAFYGGERLSALVIHPAPELLAKSTSGKNGWDQIRSMGLVDMIVLSWGGKRREFDLATGAGLTQDEVQALNQNYSVIGWHKSDFGEAYDYLYFDATGHFGIASWHQDDFDSFYSEQLLPMTRQSAAHMTLDEALIAMLKSAEAAAIEYEDEDDS